VRVGAAQNVAVEQAGHLKIGAILCAAGYFIDTVMTDGARSNDCVLLGTHALTSRE